MDLSATVLAENNRSTLSKESAMKALNNLADVAILVLFIRIHKKI